MLEHYLGFVATNWLTVIVTLVVVMFVLNYSTSLLEEQLSVIGKKMKIPTSVRGATFDAISSSLPELLTSLAGLIILKEKGLEVGIGTIGGSAIFNILIIPALVLLFYTGHKIKLSTKGIKRDSLFYILAILIFIAGLYFGQLLYMAWALISLYIAYIVYLYLQSKQHRKSNADEVQQAYDSVKDKKINFVIILISLVLIYIGVEASVVAATFIGEKLNISVLIVSLVLLASLTSIPDTLLSIKSAKKGDADAGLSNAVGSNIFDICIGLGLPLLIGILFLGLHPKVNFSDNVGVFIFLLVSTVVYFFLMHKKNLLKKDSLILFILYFLFVVYLVFIAYFK